MATAAPPKFRVPVRDGERWREDGATTGPTRTSPSGSLANNRDAESVSRPFAPLLDPFSRVAFWLAVTLPMFYLPLVFAPGAFDWPVPGAGLAASSGTVVAALVGLHFAAVVVGHGHARRLT